MIEYPGWEIDYRSMVEQTFATIDWRRAFLGEFRGLARHAGIEAHHASAFSAEPAADRRAGALSRRQTAILSATSASQCIAKWSVGFAALHPTVKIYLCMESREVWQQVFGFAPVL